MNKETRIKRIIESIQVNASDNKFIITSLMFEALNKRTIDQLQDYWEL